MDYTEIKYVDIQFGVDSKEYGSTKEKPYATIEYCMSQITTDNPTIYLANGVYITNINKLSKSGCNVNFFGNGKDTVMQIDNVSNTFLGNVIFNKLIIQLKDDYDYTEYLIRDTSSYRIEFNNVLFRKNNISRPTLRMIQFDGSSSNSYTKKEKYFRNCSFPEFISSQSDLGVINGSTVYIINCAFSCSDKQITATERQRENVTDCVYNKAFDDSYNLEPSYNHSYGVYSGINSWEKIRCLIFDNGVYKTYDADSKTLVPFMEDISEIFNIQSEANFISSFDDMKDLLLPGMKIISNKKFKTKIKAIKTEKQLILANNDFSTKLASNIDYFKSEYKLSNDSCLIKLVASVDGGLSWHSYIDNEWVVINNTVPLKEYKALNTDEKQQWNAFLDEVLEKGVNVQDIENIDFNTLEAEKIRFAYAIQIQDANSTAILENLKWQFDSIGSYSLMKDSDIDIKQDNYSISVTPKKDVELMKINVGSSGTVNITNNNLDINELSDNELRQLKDRLNNL